MIWTSILTFFNEYKSAIIIGIIMVILGLFGGYGYFLYKKNKELQKQVYLLEVQITEHEQTLVLLIDNTNKISEAKDNLIDKLNQQTAEYTKLRSTLYRDIYKNKKSLKELAQKKTTLVESLGNKKIMNTLDNLEEMTK